MSNDAGNLPVGSVPMKHRSFHLSDDVSAAYKPALYKSVQLQALLFILTSLVLDRGQMRRYFIFAMCGQWAGTIIILFRRPTSPTKTDLSFIRYALLPLFLLVNLLIPVIWNWKGGSSIDDLYRWQFRKGGADSEVGIFCVLAYVVWLMSDIAASVRKWARSRIPVHVPQQQSTAPDVQDR